MKDLSKLIICIIAAAALTAALTSDLKAQVIGGLMMNKVYTTDEIVSVLGAPDTIRWDCYYFFEYTEDRPVQAASPQVTGQVRPYYTRPKTDQIGFLREGEDKWYFYCYYIHGQVRLQQQDKGRRPHLQSQGDGLLHPRGKIR